MQWGGRLKLSAAQQYLALRSDPNCSGHGKLALGELTWEWQATPSVLGRVYSLRLQFREGLSPQVFLDSPDLVELAEGRRLPHVYDENPTKLCLYLPSSDEWHAGIRFTETLVPWASLWLYFFEEWLSSNDWKGGGQHPVVGAPVAPKRATQRAKRSNQQGRIA